MKTFIISACAASALLAAGQMKSSSLCDALSARVHEVGITSPRGSMWSRLTTGAAPAIELATVSELSLEANPEPDSRVQFEKRFRALYGNAQAVLKDLSSWDNFEIFALPGSAVRMLLSTSGPDDCESHYFFRVTVSREVVRVPDPPSGGSSDADTALCEKRGGWGYFARISGAEAFVQYRLTDAMESVNVVPLTGAGSQPVCGFTQRNRLSP